LNLYTRWIVCWWTNFFFSNLWTLFFSLVKFFSPVSLSQYSIVDAHPNNASQLKPSFIWMLIHFVLILVNHQRSLQWKMDDIFNFGNTNPDETPRKRTLNGHDPRCECYSIDIWFLFPFRLQKNLISQQYYYGAATIWISNEEHLH